MSDRNTGRQLTLGEALRALPLAAPERDAWQALARELQPQVRAPARRRFVLPAAIAAAVLALAAAVLALRAPVTHAPAPLVATEAPAAASNSTNDAKVANATNAQNAASDDDTQLAALEARSQELERWLRDTRAAAAPLPGQDLAAAAEIENLIGLVDVQLAEPHKDAQPLWRRRVNLLEDLTALRYSNYRLAGTLASATPGTAPDRIN